MHQTIKLTTADISDNMNAYLEELYLSTDLLLLVANQFLAEMQ